MHGEPKDPEGMHGESKDPEGMHGEPKDPEGMHGNCTEINLKVYRCNVYEGTLQVFICT
jgi:hypothetical protein